MTSPASSLADLTSSLLREGKRRVLMLSVLFAVVAHAALIVGLMLPKKWEANTLLVADSTAVIKPLMEGRAIATGIDDQMAVVTQTVLSRKVMREVLAFGGWLDKKRSPQEEELMLNLLRSRIRIETPREAMLRITYRDNEAKRVYLITNKLAEIFIREAAVAKETASREAYEFVDKQVKEYSVELSVAHEKLLAYYRTQGSGPVEPEVAPIVAPRPARESNAPRISAEALAELRAEEATLTSQLGRRSSPSPADESRQAEDQLRARVEQLKFDFDRLAASYTPQHPDVVRKGRDLESAKDELRRMESARAEREKARSAATALDDEVTRAARARLERVQEQIAAATQAPSRRRSSSSASSSSSPPRPVVPAAVTGVGPGEDPEMRRVGQDSKLSELLRRYEATRDVYQDLLKRRENARVSMDLDVERRGLTLRVQEPAEMPVMASGLRVMHKTVIGMVLALLVPLGLLILIVRFDGKIRSAGQIERLARVPLLISIPYSPSSREHARARKRAGVAILMVASVFAVYVAVFLLTKFRVPK